MLNSSSLRIGFIVLRFFKECSGNLESLLNLMKGLKNLGCQCSLLVPRTSPIVDRFADFPVIPYSDIPLSDFRIITIQKVLITASRSFHRHFDLLQLQLPSPAFIRVAEKIRSASTLPVIACLESSFHTSFSVSLPKDCKTIASIMIRRILNNKLLAKFSNFNVNACVVSSKYQKEELTAIKCKAPIHVIPNSTDFTHYSSSLYANTLNIPLPDSKKTICYLGHFNFLKGIDYLLDAFRIIIKDRDDVHLLLIGSRRGNYSDRIKRQVKQLGSSSVTLIEKEVDVPSLLHKISMLVLPYVASFGQQLFPSLVLEALASGTPVITSDLPPVNEIIEDGKTGFLFKTGDAKELAEKIMIVLDLKSDIEKIKKNQQILCQKNFDYNEIAPKYLTLYKEILNG